MPRPLCSTGVTPLPRYYEPLRLHSTARLRIMDSPQRSLLSYDRAAVPGLQVPSGSFCARRLLSPRRVQPVHLVEACGLILASPLLEGCPLSSTFNEAESSSLFTTARAF